jgi:RimJ/RimL family protein N-acetyltransferase
MLIQKTESAFPLLSFLKEFFYRGIPPLLWDDRLWFYSSLMPVLNYGLTGSGRDEITMFLARQGDEIQGTGLICRQGDTMTALVAACAAETTQRLVEEILSFRSDIEFLEIPTMVNGIADGRPGWEYISGDCHYWTNSATNQDNTPLPARELGKSDTWLFDSVVYPDGIRGWPEFPQYLSEGLRYFGTLVDDRLVAIAGLCQKSAFVSEIIGVGTYGECNRRKGYATACCSLALREALRNSVFCTWTTNTKNLPSRRTAERLGMTIKNDFCRVRVGPARSEHSPGKLKKELG